MATNYYLFSITNKCNKACPYCVAKDYVNNPAYPDLITRDDAFAFAEKHFRQGDLVEITGGEPTTVPWLRDFISFLNERKVDMVLRTNGYALFENIYEHLVIAFNPHSDKLLRQAIIAECYLKESDIIINPEINDSQMPKFELGPESPHSKHPYHDMAFITADGNIRPMSCRENSIGSVKEGIRENWAACQGCPFILGAWNLICRLNKFRRPE